MNLIQEFEKIQLASDITNIPSTIRTEMDENKDKCQSLNPFKFETMTSESSKSELFGSSDCNCDQSETSGQNKYNKNLYMERNNNKKSNVITKSKNNIISAARLRDIGKKCMHNQPKPDFLNFKELMEQCKEIETNSIKIKKDEDFSKTSFTKLRLNNNPVTKNQQNPQTDEKITPSCSIQARSSADQEIPEIQELSYLLDFHLYLPKKESAIWSEMMYC
ncbi:unnamed protein product [Diamesa tonsa]